MLHTLSKEFTCKSLSLRSTKDEKDLFTKSQWSDSTRWFLVYRLSIWLYQLSWSVGYIVYLQIHYPDRLNRIHRYFTSWADVMTVLYYSAALGICVVSAHYRKTNQIENKPLRCLRAVTWFLHTVVINSSVIVMLIFWIFVSAKFKEEKLRNVFNIHRHAVNSVLVFVDFCVVATPVRLMHVVYGYIYGLTYAFATVLMYWLGDTPTVYKFLNWEDHPGKAVVVSLIVGIVVPTVLHFCFFMLHLVKMRVAEHCTKCTSAKDHVVSTPREENSKETLV